MVSTVHCIVNLHCKGTIMMQVLVFVCLLVDAGSVYIPVVYYTGRINLSTLCWFKLLALY